ncbi:TAXI family TRAP transporter solute-binding subunit [Oceanisphaera arctica]|uniref:C4-dicarboxylate ABC transporter substrate-binding protein n=1 Tax=Oceanisphaera arctica TaxID=641510 RepID=A0A2P5TPZ7_9GAMM|nr:TAXI family TRAP transporter solute-binding subunit [Oceanisphaera arctica]PPL17757.1 C4-dicarboxylate ABC transporter substrate-binding protein [Oceanisphaera arctica]GHA18126.1 C4-dicarboxylate ABC transporter substrate-binding protein [Oceanisphaera arctica]
MSIRKNQSRRLALTFGLLAALSAPMAGMAAEPVFITMGTGGMTGVYYPTGGAICRLVNQGRAEHGIRCSVESTGGSPHNIASLRRGELELGMVQSDVEYQAYQGTGPFAEQGPYQELRSVFALHGEALTIVARKEANIHSFEDLKGKKVNIGNPGSGHRETMDSLLQAYGWSHDDFGQVSELRPAEHSQALCNNRIDAFVYVVGHPNGSIREAASACEVNLVSISDAVVEKLVAEHSYYRPVTLAGGQYRGTEEEIHTFEVSANLVTHASVPEPVIYELTKAVFDHFEQFIRMHPSLTSLQPAQMIGVGLSAPLHPGASRYFREKGWLE